MALSLFVVAGLPFAWRITPGATSHQLTFLGTRLTYPAANLGAVVMLGFAAMGLAVLVRTARGAQHELVAVRRFVSRLPRDHPLHMPGVVVVEDRRPQAFCAGLLRPRVYVSTAAVALLDESALDAVIAHEFHHARRRDPLRLAVGRVLVRALFFMPGLAGLARRHRDL